MLTFVMMTILSCLGTEPAVGVVHRTPRAGELVELDLDLKLDDLTRRTLAKYGERITVLVSFSDPNAEDGLDHLVETQVAARSGTIHLRVKVPEAIGKKPVDMLSIDAITARRGHPDNLIDCDVLTFDMNALPDHTAMSCKIFRTPAEIERNRAARSDE